MSLQNAIQIDILDGNLFECDFGRSDLPAHDKNSGIYECGSNSFNDLYYAWLGMLFFAVMCAAWLW